MVTFSIDGATKTSYEQIRVLGNFDQSLRNYQDLLQLRLDGKTRPNTRIQILYVLQKSNLYDFRHMCELRKSLPGIHSLNIVPSPDDVQAMLRELDAETATAATEDDQKFYLA